MSERLQSSSALLQFGFVSQRSPVAVGAHLGSLLRQILQVNIVLGTPGKCLFSTAAMLLATASSRLRTILGPVRVGSYPSSSVMSRSLRLLTPPLSDAGWRGSVRAEPASGDALAVLKYFAQITLR